MTIYSEFNHITIREVQHIPTGVTIKLRRDNKKGLYILDWMDKHRRYLDSHYLPHYTNEKKALAIFNSYFWMIPEGDLIYAK